MQEFYDIFFPLQLTSILSWWIILTAAVFLAAILYGISSLLHHRASRPKPLHSSRRWDTEKAPSPSFLVDNEEDFLDEEIQDDALVQENKYMIEEEILQEDEEMFQNDNEEEINEREEVPWEFQNEKPPVWFGVSRLSRLLFWRKPKNWTSDLPSSESENEEDSIEYTDTDWIYDSENLILNEVEIANEIVESDNEKAEILLWNDDSSEILMTEQVIESNEQKARESLHRESLQSELERLGKKKQWDVYEEKLISWLSQDPHHMGILEYLADYYMSQDLIKKALPLYKKLVDKEAENHNFLWKMAKAYRLLGDEEMTEVLLKRALSLHPRTPKYATDLVELYYERNNVTQAIDLMEEVVQRRPENMGYRKVLIYFYEEKEEYNKIVESYESMLVVNPTDMTIKRKLLEARSRLQR